MGLEPTAFGTTNRRSNQLSYNVHLYFLEVAQRYYLFLNILYFKYFFCSFQKIIKNKLLFILLCLYIFFISSSEKNP